VITKASAYSRRFPRGHHLNSEFVRWYQLGDELGAGGYGFVLTAFHRLELREVAVKFIIKAKVPAHAWMEDKSARRVPTEALLLGLLNHPNIVKCMDLFEDDLYFYLVQELHGTPWVPHSKDPLARVPIAVPGKASFCLPTPALTPSPSVDSDLHLPITPPQSSAGTGDFPREPGSAKQLASSPKAILDSADLSPSCHRPSQPAFFRRPSHDLFECIEQSKDKRLSENQARFVFAQIVEAVHYLDSQGVTHCDIKDENILVDNYLNVKLVDFGSAVVVDPSEPRPCYTLFFGTTAYAASEVLLKRPYRAPPAEVWTLGVLLSYLLTGASPFPTERDAVAGRVSLAVHASVHVPESAEQLMLRCLDPDPERRANIYEVRAHPWLQGALDLPLEERIL
ncbi:kinase-like protein, partial [Russula emetica]